MVIEIEPGVSWYDNFSDMEAGQGTPNGWTMYGSSPTEPTCVVDGTAFGGRRLDFPNPVSPSLPYAMGLDIAGTPDDWEVLIRMKVNIEVAHASLNSYWGAPGGRISFDTKLGYIGAQMSNRKSRNVCGWRCSNFSRDHGMWLPPYAENFVSNLRLSSSTNDGLGPLQSHAVLATWATSGLTSLQTSDESEESGIQVASWSLMRYRYNKDTNRIRIRWWPDNNALSGEPNTWMIDTTEKEQIPDVNGSTGFVAIADSLSGSQKTLVDYIAVSIDPEGGFPAEVPESPRILSECPLPNGERGVAYTFTLEADT